MTAPPTLREIFLSPRETLWWSATVLMLGWALLFSSGYVTFGSQAAGPAYYVIDQTMGVRLNNIVTLAVGLVMLAVLILRSPWTAVVILAWSAWCTWQAIAFWAGYAATGVGWGGGPTWTFFMLFGLLWYVGSPLMMRGVPGHPTRAGNSPFLHPRARRRTHHLGAGTGAA